MTIKKAIIPAAGLGTRNLPATKSMPKEMLPLVDTPALFYAVEEIINAGIDDILIVTGRGKTAIEDFFDNDAELVKKLRDDGKDDLANQIEHVNSLADIHYIRQKEARGLGHAIFCAKKHIGNEPFVVLLGDTFYSSETPVTKQVVEVFTKFGKTVIACEVVGKSLLDRYGILKCEQIRSYRKTFLIEDLVEKPGKIPDYTCEELCIDEEKTKYLGVIGRYVLTPGIFDYLENLPAGAGGEIQLTDALQMQCRKEAMYGYICEGERYDIGTKLGYAIAFIDYALKNPEIGDDVKRFFKKRIT